MFISSPERTVFDLIRHVHASGHLSNVATVFEELGEAVAPKSSPPRRERPFGAGVQRVGYLLEWVGQDALAEPLAAMLGKRRKRPALLRPDGSAMGAPFDKRWSLFINE